MLFLPQQVRCHKGLTDRVYRDDRVDGGSLGLLPLFWLAPGRAGVQGCVVQLRPCRASVMALSSALLMVLVEPCCPFGLNSTALSSLAMYAGAPQRPSVYRPAYVGAVEVDWAGTSSGYMPHSSVAGWCLQCLWHCIARRVAPAGFVDGWGGRGIELACRLTPA